MVMICEPGGKGLIFPLLEAEQHWPKELRAALYIAALLWCFLGVSMVANIFMESIEALTSRRKKVRKGDGRFYTDFVWNDTIADLSLMALGSSAPEIFLSIIDLVRREMYSGDLGASVIVGSAAFNLLVIIAVCVLCIPPGGSRLIEQLPVFYLTAAFSLFAYFWIAFVLAYNTPNVVELWEAVLTFLYLPLLIFLSWRLSVAGVAGLLPCCATRPNQQAEEPPPQSQQTVQIMASPRTAAAPQSERRSGSEDSAATASQASCASQALPPKSKSLRKSDSMGSISTTKTTSMPKRTSRRVSIASRYNDAMFNHRANRLTKTLSSGSTRSSACSASREASSPHRMEALAEADGPGQAKKGALDGQVSNIDTVVQFYVSRQCLSDGCSKKVVKVVRTGRLSFDIQLKIGIELVADSRVSSWPFRTVFDGDLKLVSPRPMDHNMIIPATVGTVILPAGWTEHSIGIERPHKFIERPGACEDFIIHIMEATSVPGRPRADADAGAGRSAPSVELGHLRASYIEVLRARSPGLLSFHAEVTSVQGKAEEQTLDILVLRREGCWGKVRCKYALESSTAVPGYDYEEQEGEVGLEPGETEQLVSIKILEKALYRSRYELLVVLTAHGGDSIFDPNQDGGEDSAILTVTLEPIETATRPRLRTLDYLMNFCSISLGFETWVENFKSSLKCNGSWEDQAEATWADWAFHITCLPWKLMFALVPPTTFCRGWLCFVLSLAFIALVTAVIADFAELFGCVLDVTEMITAITFVALGTSMPDLFASKVAAIEDDTADASIINVTGSNSVNVFLGLGLPWMLGAVHWSFSKRTPTWNDKYKDMAATLDREGNLYAVFYVESGNLGFSVLTFCYVCAIAILLLLVRRRFLGAELGGPYPQRVATVVAFGSCWVGYVVLASWRSLRWEKATHLEAWLFIGGGYGIIALISLWPLISIICHGKREADEDEPEQEQENDYPGTPTEAAILSLVQEPLPMPGPAQPKVEDSLKESIQEVICIPAEPHVKSIPVALVKALSQQRGGQNSRNSFGTRVTPESNLPEAATGLCYDAFGPKLISDWPGHAEGCTAAAAASEKIHK